MKKLTDHDIETMIQDDFNPDIVSERRIVREHLRLTQRIPTEHRPLPEYVTLDLHMKTEEEAWNSIMNIAVSGIRHAKIITGASGILKIKFQQWARDSLLSPYIISATPINNGSFDVIFRKNI